jgi:hypothetical protein
MPSSRKAALDAVEQRADGQRARRVADDDLSAAAGV